MCDSFYWVTLELREQKSKNLSQFQVIFASLEIVFVNAICEIFLCFRHSFHIFLNFFISYFIYLCLFIYFWWVKKKKHCQFSLMALEMCSVNSSSIQSYLKDCEKRLSLFYQLHSQPDENFLIGKLVKKYTKVGKGDMGASSIYVWVLKKFFFTP